MCEYQEINEKGQKICAPVGDECLYCVCGNSRRYNEIKQKVSKENE